MSFLLGAFGKMSAGRRQREIESQKMRIQSRLRRATKQIGIVDKQIAKAEQADKNNLKAQVTAAKQQAQLQLQSTMGISGLSSTSNPTGVDQAKLTEYNTQLAGITGNADAYYTTLEQQVADYYENLRDTQLEPLKQEEDLLKTELEQLESQALLAKNDLEFCTKMEEGGAKELAPKYTGGN